MLMIKSGLHPVSSEELYLAACAGFWKMLPLRGRIMQLHAANQGWHHTMNIAQRAKNGRVHVGIES